MGKYTYVFFAQHREDNSKNKYIVVRTEEFIHRTSLAETLDSKFPEYAHINGRHVSGHIPIERVEV